MFHFFPGNYTWSQAALRLLFTGGSIGEVGPAVTALQGAAEKRDTERWYEVWRELGDRLAERGRQQAGEGHGVSARGTNLRACAYYQWAGAFTDHDDARRGETHQRSLDCFGSFAELSDPPIERVEVPYERAAFPAWFVPVGRPGPAPTAVYLPGWDSTKEQGIELALALRERGIATLLCDGPGIGEAVLFRGLINRHDYEVPGSAAVDYCLSRPDVDAQRLAAIGSSLGGYRVARVAAFEHRLAAAVAWGAIWDFQKVWEAGQGARQPTLPTTGKHALHVMGAASLEEVSAKLASWNLAGVAEKIRCPFLVVHGERDTQIPVEDARRVHEAAGSAHKDLKVFTEAEGGSAHCQNDHRTLAHDYIGDWLTDVLPVRAAGAGSVS